MHAKAIGTLLVLAAVALASLPPAPAVAIPMVIATFVLGFTVARARSTTLRILAVVPVISLIAIHADDTVSPWQLVALGSLLAVLAGPGARTNHQELDAGIALRGDARSRPTHCRSNA